MNTNSVGCEPRKYRTSNLPTLGKPKLEHFRYVPLYRVESNPQNLNFKPGESTNGKTELELEHVRVGTNTESNNGVTVYGIVFRQASMILMI